MSLARLEGYNCGNKRDRSKALKILGQLQGQIQAFVGRPPFAKVETELRRLLADEAKLNEPEKWRIMEEVHAALDEFVEESLRTAMERKDAGQSP